jgi:hypothetical protein
VLIPDSLNSDSLNLESRVAAAQNGGQPPKPKRQKITLTDEEFLTDLEKQYTYLDVRKVNLKMVNWCRVNGKQATRRRLVNWLNREDVPIGAKRPDVGRYDPATEKPFVPDPPCPTCGKDVCFDLHREAA